MRRLIVLVLLALSAVWVRPAWACSCAAPPAFDEALAAAEVAFVGHVVTGVVGGEVEVLVEGVIKGSVRSIVVLRADLATGTSCQTRPPGQRPIAYAGPARLYTGPCAFTLFNVEDARDMTLRPPLPGREYRGPGWENLLVAVLAVAALPLARQTRAERLRRRADAIELEGLRLSR